MSKYLDGDPERAQARFRQLADEASTLFSVGRLNAFSLMLAMHIDEMLGQPGHRQKQIDQEIDAEVAGMRKKWDAMMGDSPSG
jgi:hypothetical protein